MTTFDARPEVGLPGTTLPRREIDDSGSRRQLSGVSTAGTLNVFGAGLCALFTARLLFGFLSPLSGPFGFVIVTFVVFVGAYAFFVSMTEARPVVVDKVMTVLFAAAAAVTLLAVGSVVLYTFLHGRKALLKTNFYTHDMSRAGPQSPLSTGGIGHAIVGTLIITGISILLTVPLGIATAVFVNEFKGRAANLIRTVVDAMTALPSILAGLFIFATWILVLGFPRAGLAAAMAVSIMMLPIIIRSSDVVLRLVPGNLREAAAALGSSQWRSVWSVVLPTARSGLATSVILGVARGVGETAPVLLTAGFTASMNLNALKDPMVNLPLVTFQFVRSPTQNIIDRGFATAAVLMVVVLILFALARFIGGHGPGQVSKRQARRLARRSARDAVRFDSLPGRLP